VSISEENGSSNGNPQKEQVLDLCTRVFASQIPRNGYIQWQDLKYLILPLKKSQKPPIYWVALQQVLENKEMPQLQRTQRYGLALNLASSFLQLFESMWLNTIEKHDVLFFASSTGPSYITDEPFLKSDSSPNTPDRGGSTDVSDRADSLSKLGILLLELCFGKTVGETSHRLYWGVAENARQNAGYDLLAAGSWLSDVTQEAGLDYAEAVEWCLGGNKLITHDQWRLVMFQKVIEPLQRCYDSLRRPSTTAR
jgi:hypothetical protein